MGDVLELLPAFERHRDDPNIRHAKPRPEKQLDTTVGPGRGGSKTAGAASFAKRERVLFLRRTTPARQRGSADACRRACQGAGVTLGQAPRRVGHRARPGTCDDSRLEYDSGCRAASLCFQRFSFLRWRRGSADRPSPPPAPSTRAPRRSRPLTRVESPAAEPEPLAIPPDWKGVRRDTGYFLGYQFVAIAVLYVMPTSVTNWDRSGDHLEQVVGQRHPSHLGRRRLLHQLPPASVLGRDVLHPRPRARPEPLAIGRLLGPSLDPVRVRRRGPVREAVLSGSRHHAAARLAARRVRLHADPQQHQVQGRPARRLGQVRAGPHRSPGCRQRPDQSTLRRRDAGGVDAVPRPERVAADLRPARSALYAGGARPEHGPTASAREARPGACSWTCAGRRILPGASRATVPLSSDQGHTDAMRTAHSWRRWWPAVVAAWCSAASGR